MQTVARGYRGFSLLVQLNTDRLLMTATLAAALVLGGLIGNML